jgi:hypothetical protein
MYTAISIKVVHEQSGKVEYERERLLGIANKLMNFQCGSQQPFALVFDFSSLLGDNLNWNSCMLCSVAYLYLLNLNELVWQLYLVLNPPSVRPIYDSYRSRQPLRGFLAMLSLTNILHLAIVYSVIDTQYDAICGKNKKVSTSHLVEWSPFVLTRYDVILCIYNQGRRNDVKARGGADFRERALLDWYILRDVCKTSGVELRLIMFSIYWMIWVWGGSPPGVCAILEARWLHVLRFLKQIRKRIAVTFLTIRYSAKAIL